MTRVLIELAARESDWIRRENPLQSRPSSTRALSSSSVVCASVICFSCRFSVATRGTGAARDSGLVTGVATVSEAPTCDEPRLPQAIAATHANEALEGCEACVSFEGRAKLSAALELAKEFKKRSFAQGVNAPC